MTIILLLILVNSLISSDVGCHSDGHIPSFFGILIGCLLLAALIYYHPPFTINIAKKTHSIASSGFLNFPSVFTSLICLPLFSYMFAYVIVHILYELAFPSIFTSLVCVIFVTYMFSCFVFTFLSTGFCPLFKSHNSYAWHAPFTCLLRLFITYANLFYPCVFTTLVCLPFSYYMCACIYLLYVPFHCNLKACVWRRNYSYTCYLSFFPLREILIQGNSSSMTLNEFHNSEATFSF